MRRVHATLCTCGDVNHCYHRVLIQKELSAQACMQLYTHPERPYSNTQIVLLHTICLHKLQPCPNQQYRESSLLKGNAVCLFTQSLPVARTHMCVVELLRFVSASLWVGFDHHGMSLQNIKELQLAQCLQEVCVFVYLCVCVYTCVCVCVRESVCGMQHWWQHIDIGPPVFIAK